MKKIHMVALFATAVALGACTGSYESSETRSNGIEVRKIVEIEGCRLYRVDPGGVSRVIYTTICGSGEASTQVSQSCGKSCSYPEVTPTVFRPNRPIK